MALAQTIGGRVGCADMAIPNPCDAPLKNPSHRPPCKGSGVRTTAAILAPECTPGNSLELIKEATSGTGRGRGWRSTYSPTCPL